MLLSFSSQKYKNQARFSRKVRHNAKSLATVLVLLQAIISSIQNGRELESCYLEFVSEVTRDILRRNVFTRPAMDLLCQTHIHRHRHRLREVRGGVEGDEF